MDFGEVRTIIKKWIDETLDHTMLLCRDDPLIPVLRERDEKFYLMEKNPTAENLAEHIYDYAQSQNFPIVSVTLWESDSSFARFSR